MSLIPEMGKLLRGEQHTGAERSELMYDDILTHTDRIRDLYRRVLALEGTPATDTGAITQAWSSGSWTPTWAGTGTAPAAGNATLTGRYIATANWVFCTIYMQWGSTTNSNNSTEWNWTLPASHDMESGVNVYGAGHLNFASSSWHYPLSAEIRTSAPTKMYGIVNHTTGYIGHGAPGTTWTTNDEIWLSAWYPRDV